MKKKFLALLLCIITVLNPVVGFANEFTKVEDTNLKEVKETVEETDVIEETDYEFNKETQTITKYNGSDKEIIIPEKIDGVLVKHIGKQAFGRKKLESVVIPNGVETLDEGAFAGNNLKSITLPKSILRLEKIAFASNVNLKEVNLNEGLEYIGQQAFSRNKSMKETIVIPSTVNIVMTSAFKGTGITNLEIKGNGESTPLILKSGLSESLANINLESPYKKIIVHFNTCGCENKNNTINLGTIVVPTNNVEDIKISVEKDIKSTVAASYASKEDISGESDIIKEYPIIWDYENINFSSKEFEITGKSETFTNDMFPSLEGYSDINAENCNAINIFKLKVKAEETEKESWNENDFEYDFFEYKGNMQVPVTKWGIKGFSEIGKEKNKENKNLIIPKEVNISNEKKSVDGIISGAFKDCEIDSVIFPETKGDYDFIIGDSTFENTGLKKVEFNEGIKTIGSHSFFGNELEEVYIPSTVLSIGNSAFKNNQINKLIISDDVNKIQIDNYSFSNNKLKEVNLPFSIFKFLEGVFKGNPGTVKLDSDKLDKDDPEGTGVVQLYTRNKEHLGTGTYIKLSKYHSINNIAEGIDRSKLWETIEKANVIYLKDYKEENINEFSKVLEESKNIFSNKKSTQEEINNSNTKLIEAISKLRASSADKTKLRDLINKTNELNEELFTKESFEKLKIVLKEAEKIVGNIDSTSEEVDNITIKLGEVFDNLVISENAIYNVNDFTYDGNKITGFSNSGTKKFEVNKELYLPDKTDKGITIEVIGKKAFQMDGKYVEYGTDVIKSPYGIKTVRFPENLKTIEEDAFRENNLSTLELPNELEYIGNSAFNGNQLIELKMPNSIKELGFGVFSLNLLEKVELSKSLTEIANGTFSRNIHLKHIDLHEGITTIGASAFTGAPLKEIQIPSTVVEIKTRAFSANRLENIKIPGTVKKIDSKAFEQNKKFRTLKNVDLRNGIEEIGNNAFGDGLITEANLPKSLVKIGDSAFKGNMDSGKNEVIVKLYTSNKDHLKFNNDKSKVNQEIIYDEKIIDKNLTDKLDILFERVNDLDKNDYSKSSYDNLLKVKKESEELLKEDITDEKLETAIENIENAINSLDKSSKTVPSSPSEPSKPVFENISRIAGENRYKTAIEISKKRFKNADTVILASGSNFADALTAQGLTSVYNGPLLLSGLGEAQKDVEKEISRLGAKNIIVVGGEKSISNNEIKNYEIKTERIAGSDRYETASKIGEIIFKNNKSNKNVIIADGRNYPDALSISSYATSEGIPVLLSENNKLSQRQEKLLSKYKIKEGIIVGGENSVGMEIDKLFVKRTRIAGNDRYETASNIAKEFFKNPKEVFIASGENYPDALTVSYYASYKNAPILLVNKNTISKKTMKYLKDNNVESFNIVGGSRTINEFVIEEIINK